MKFYILVLLFIGHIAASLTPDPNIQASGVSSMEEPCQGVNDQDGCEQVLRRSESECAIPGKEVEPNIDIRLADVQCRSKLDCAPDYYCRHGNCVRIPTYLQSREDDDLGSALAIITAIWDDVSNVMIRYLSWHTFLGPNSKMNPRLLRNATLISSVDPREPVSMAGANLRLRDNAETDELEASKPCGKSCDCYPEGFCADG
ncbi:hypothetical protein BDV28DRAFT_145411 [Aspergillus coremiiformis]|uniref:Uncharacterized protein n=1 Tax=Aspergillus coremiiformis TaxID=138285 RepID=A0A5N6ZFQ2_9EURO|nr:hypothetical protein BDV28DRAFT_145411 [Aspergillus coremiiformis]